VHRCLIPLIRILPAVALTMLLATPADGQSLSYSGAFQFATGDYIFTERTDSVYLISGLDVEAGPVRFAVTLPVIGQSTPWIAYGLVPLPSGGTSSGEVARQVRQGRMGSRSLVTLPVVEEGVDYEVGVGDPVVRGDIEVVREGDRRPSIRLNASAKAPVADPEDGSGTGQWDVGGGLSIAKRIGRNSLLADLGYWRFGDLPDLELSDSVAYSVGYGRILDGGRWAMLASVSGWSSIIDGADPPVQVGVGVSRLFARSRSVAITAGVGVTETAPDFTVSLGWRLGLLVPR
jgi:hypothetical protein